MEKKLPNRKPVETKQVERKMDDTDLLGQWDYSEFENNRLSLSNELKTQLRDLGLEWRFINKREFTRKGNVHSSQWKPFNVSDNKVVSSFQGTTPEGIIERGDLILAVRPKKLGDIYKKRQLEKNARYSDYDKQQAEELRRLARQHDIAGEVRVHEGYEDNG